MTQNKWFNWWLGGSIVFGIGVSMMSNLGTGVMSSGLVFLCGIAVAAMFSYFDGTL